MTENETEMKMGGAYFWAQRTDHANCPLIYCVNFLDVDPGSITVLCGQIYTVALCS